MLGAENTEVVTLPEQLQKIVPAEEFVKVRHRWNTNEVMKFLIKNYTSCLDYVSCYYIQGSQQFGISGKMSGIPGQEL